MRLAINKCWGIFGLVIVLFISLPTIGQKVEAYPSNWFVQMKLNKVQVLLRAPNSDLSKSTVSRALRDSYEISADTKKMVLE